MVNIRKYAVLGVALTLFMGTGHATKNKDVKSLSGLCASDLSAKYLKQFSNLENLNLFSHHITDEHFSVLPPSLISLNLGWCQYAGNITFVEFEKLAARCPKLESLNLTHFHMTDKLVAALSKWPNFKNLDLYCSGITNDQLAALPSSLISLNLRSCLVTAYGLLKLSVKCPNLEDLDLAYFDITDDLVRALGRFPNLKSLDLGGCEITDGQLAMLPQSLEHLKLFHCNITDERLAILLGRCPNLKSLDLTWGKITNEGVALLAQKCPNLKSLCLSSCHGITDDVVQVLPTSLNKINLSYCYGIRGDALTLVSERCPDLTSLRLANCNITDVGLVILLERCSNLKSLDLSNCHELIGTGLARLAEQCPFLENLNLMCCEEMTDDVFDALPVSLKGMDLSEWCFGLSRRARLGEGGPNLKRIPNSKLIKLEKKRPHLKITIY